MASIYIKGKKFSGSNWYDLKVASTIEDNEGSVPSSALLSSVSKRVDEIIQEFDSASAFPVTGKENVIYVDKSTNTIYRWDDANVKFYCIGSDYNSIEVIDGTF